MYVEPGCCGAKGLSCLRSPTDEGIYTQRASGRAASREWMNCYESVDNETMDDETMDRTIPSAPARTIGAGAGTGGGRNINPNMT